MVKDIALCYGERVKSMKLDVNESRGISEEVSNALDVQLIHIDTQRFEGKTTLLFGQKTDSDGGGVIENLADELKNVV